MVGTWIVIPCIFLYEMRPQEEVEWPPVLCLISRIIALFSMAFSVITGVNSGDQAKWQHRNEVPTCAPDIVQLCF